MAEKFFNLQEKEKIIEEIKPLSSLKWYFFFTGGSILGISSILIVIVAFCTIISLPVFLIALISFFGLFTIFIILAVIFFGFIIAHLRYEHQHYWITNKRVMYKKGLIGYSISSIPLERISDIIISRSFIERLFGFGSLHVQTLAGQVTYGRRLGAEASLLAVPDPEGIQKMIFELVKRKRKEEHLTM